jgi:hypothetical protein
MKRVTVIIVLSLIALTGVWYAVVAKPRHFSTAMAANASQITIWEGLPNGGSGEAELLKSELEKKTTFRIQRYPFYTEPLTFEPADVSELKRLLAEPATYPKRGPAKACGGFHPDYAVSWETDRGTLSVLFCFGCREIKVIGTNIDDYFDMGTENRLSNVLKKYRKNRPLSDYYTGK